MQPDTFGLYVRQRLEEWGTEFALSRDCEYLGHVSRNVLQVLIDHRGEMPPPRVGFKPLEVCHAAHQIEMMVTDIARAQLEVACVLRAYYCGSGRRMIERLEIANELLHGSGCSTVSRTRYIAIHDIGFATVRGMLVGMAMAA